jgi:glycosyltransferase involved in cell wall biosynthesis
VNLVIVHYHLRPGGIRRIIELATPHLVREAPRTVTGVVLATGQAADRKWHASFEKQLGGLPVAVFIEHAFNYVSEQRADVDGVRRKLRRALVKLLAESDAANCLVWAHNLGVARNLILTRELVRACDERGVPLIAHHHDWWFDNRWLRWPEMKRFGVRTLESAARTIFPTSPRVRHISINHADALILERHFDKRAGWLPNLTGRTDPPARARLREARLWLQRKLKSDAPVWILPCRLLRRKNVAEALLLKRWLRPEAWLITTGGVSSADEQLYANKLAAGAHRHHWRLRLGVLSGDETRKPSVAELLAVSEVVMLTSIQEGFGLPYLEAVTSRRPLIARSIPNIAPDLEKFGFEFPQYYEEIFVDPRLFDWRAEQQRQVKLFCAWRQHLPGACRRWISEAVLLAAGSRPQPVPFSRLTLTAQLELLAQPAPESWGLCAPLNSFLPVWKKRAAHGRLRLTRWPGTADDWLSGPAYGHRFHELLHAEVEGSPSVSAGVAAQNEFIRAKLDAAHLFPLLWSKQS